MPFGGGGSLHAGALMKEIGLAASIIPRYPGVTSALGCVVADMRLDIVQTVNAMLDELDISELTTKMEDQALKFEQDLSRTESLIGLSRMFELDMLYVGQTHSIHVPLTGDPKEFSLKTIREAFNKIYLETYGRLLPGIGYRVINMRVAVIGHRPKLDLSSMAPISSKKIEQCVTGNRSVWCDGNKVNTQIYERLDLPIDAKIFGPAILEQPDTTIFIEPKMYGKVDKFGNLIIRWNKE
jgi:N-methylhydantoinase A